MGFSQGQTFSLLQFQLSAVFFGGRGKRKLLGAFFKKAEQRKKVELKRSLGSDGCETIFSGDLCCREGSPTWMGKEKPFWRDIATAAKSSYDGNSEARESYEGDYVLFILSLTLSLSPFNLFICILNEMCAWVTGQKICVFEWSCDLHPTMVAFILKCSLICSDPIKEVITALKQSKRLLLSFSLSHSQPPTHTHTHTLVTID